VEIRGSMKKSLSTAIRIMLVFQAVYHVFWYAHYFINLYDKVTEGHIISFIFNYLIPFSIPIVLFCLVWINSEKISEKLIGNNDEYIINLNYKEIISIIIIAFGGFFLLFNIGILVNNICYLLSLILEEKRYIKFLSDMGDKSSTYRAYFTNVYNIGSSIIEIIISLCLLKYRRKIIKCFENL
jgi:hypothetical protein